MRGSGSLHVGNVGVVDRADDPQEGAHANGSGTERLGATDLLNADENEDGGGHDLYETVNPGSYVSCRDEIEIGEGTASQ